MHPIRPSDRPGHDPGAFQSLPAMGYVGMAISLTRSRAPMNQWYLKTIVHASTVCGGVSPYTRSRPYRNNVIHKRLACDDGGEMSVPNFQRLTFARNQIRFEIMSNEHARAFFVLAAMPDNCADDIFRDPQFVHQASGRAAQIVRLERSDRQSMTTTKQRVSDAHRREGAAHRVGK